MNAYTQYDVQMSFKAPWDSIETHCEAWGKWNGCTLDTSFTAVHFFNLSAGTDFLLCLSAQKGCLQCNGYSVRTIKIDNQQDATILIYLL